MRLETRRPGTFAERGRPGPRPARAFAVPPRAAGPAIDPAVQLESARRYGHHLGTFGVSVQRPAPAPAWIGGPFPSAPIQRVPWWKKALYGVGGALGTVAAGAGALGLAGATAALSPLAAGGLLLGGLGVGAYSAYKGLNVANDDRKAVSGAVHETRATLAGLGSQSKKRELTEREKLLHGLLSDTVPYLDGNTGNTTVEPTTGRSELAFPPPGGEDLQEKNARANRRYNLRVNPDQGNLPTHILHELIHVDSDQKYRGNRTPYEDLDSDDRLMPFNTHSDEVFEAAEELSGQVQQVLDVVRDDRTLSRGQRSYLTERLDYAKKSSESEYDTVMSELVYYLHRSGIPEKSATSQIIVAKAHAARELRNS